MRRAQVFITSVVLLCTGFFGAGADAAENANALHLQARELLRRQQVSAAVAQFERAAAAEPRSSKHRQWLARALGLQTAQKGIGAGLTGVSRVKAEFEKAIELDPNNLEARHDLAVLYKVVPRIFGGSTAKAAEQVEIIRQRSPALATQIEADFLARDKKPKEALALLEQSVRLDSSRPRPHVSMAVLYQNLKDWDRAFAALDRALAILSDAYASGNKVLICGNGGSAADCEHIVGELMKGFRKPRRIPADHVAKLEAAAGALGTDIGQKMQGALAAISLVSHVSLATAIANDTDADMVFAQQVYGLGRAGDVVLSISTSGNARNVINAVATAKAFGMRSVILTGRTGGALAPMGDVAIRVPADSVVEIQELHLPVYHWLCIELERKFFST